jgi:hypothetical protein
MKRDKMKKILLLKQLFFFTYHEKVYIDYISIIFITHGKGSKPGAQFKF